MKNFFALLLLILAAYCCATAQPKPEPALGFNNTRLMDLLTDQSGKLIPENVEVLKTIPENINKVARWPHGAAARTYDFDEPGYGDVTTGKRTENYIFEFIKLCKIFRWSLCVVFNVTPEYLDPSKTAAWQDKNMRMLDEFVKAGIPISVVEVGGNESNMHCVLDGIKGAYQDKPSLANRLFKTNEKYEAEMQKYYNITMAYHKLVKARYPHLKTAATFGSPYNARDRRWNAIMAKLPTEGGIFHWYQDDPNTAIWDKTFKEVIAPVVNAGKTPICTEYSFNFGPDSQKNSSLKSTDINEQYCSFFVNACRKYGVAIALRHRIAGADGGPYDYVTIPR